jgi:hypothetical protein
VGVAALGHASAVFDLAAQPVFLQDKTRAAINPAIPEPKTMA